MTISANLTQSTNAMTRGILVVALIFVLGACVPGLNAPDPNVARDIADRIGAQPSWKGIIDYLDRAFSPGLTRDEVHGILDKVGPYRVTFSDPVDGAGDATNPQLVYRETIKFTETNTSMALYGWHFAYDKNGKLVDAHRLES